MVLTMAAVAANKGISPDKLEVHTNATTEKSSGETRTIFSSSIDLGQGLTDRERRILLNSARYCEVHKLLSSVIEFKEVLAES
jgi:uncharacterized OsmC-like protein